jgi:hypothetical protein
MSDIGGVDGAAAETVSAVKQSSAAKDALRLAYYSRPSFPCRADKRPACPHGFKDATADPEKLRELWRQYPGDLVGVPTGEASGLFVIDIDSGRHHEAQDWLEHASPNLPPTRWHATKSGGWHILFKHQPGLKNSAGKLAKGVDTRGDGGYVIWWPLHLGLAAPHKIDHDIADLPAWLGDQLIADPVPNIVPVTRWRRSLYPRTASLDGIVRTVFSAGEGERNACLFWSACRIGEMAARGEIGRQQFSGACNALVAAAMATGLSRKEAERTISSAMRYGR